VVPTSIPNYRHVFPFFDHPAHFLIVVHNSVIAAGSTLQCYYGQAPTAYVSISNVFRTTGLARGLSKMKQK